MLHFEGTVVKSIGKDFTVRDDEGRLILCWVRGKFRVRDGLKATNPVAIGDRVRCSPATSADGPGMIEEVLPRHNYILRKAIAVRGTVHVLCANVDQAVLVVTLISPRTSYGFVDRFLSVAEMFHIPVMIVLNKVDLYQDEALQAQQAEFCALYESLGYPVISTEALDPASAPVVRDLLGGKTTFLCGHSGSGKSSLVNLLDPALNLKTREVSGYHHKGQHTTTHSEMFPLADGGYVIDAPGIKELGIAELEKSEVSHYFTEMRDLLDSCRFNNCLHLNEPGCAIVNAVESGQIAESRYRSYLGILEEIAGDQPF